MSAHWASLRRVSATNATPRPLRTSAALLLALLSVAQATPSSARPISERDDFRIGRGEDVCVAQLEPARNRHSVTFDRTYSLLCQDASEAVGTLHVLYQTKANAYVSVIRGAAIQCGEGRPVDEGGLGNLTRAQCNHTERNLPHVRYSLTTGRRVYVAEGLAGFESALLSGLRSLVKDRELDEPISIPGVTLSGITDLARARAEGGEALSAFHEGFDLNSEGRYAEAAEYFSVLLRDPATPEAIEREILAAYGLQQSNLGAFQDADATFEQLDALPRSTEVAEQFVRNARATHLVNAKRLDEARSVLRTADDPALAVSPSRSGIDQMTADQLNSGSVFLRLATDRAVPLPVLQRSILLAAQRHLIEATILRLSGSPDAAAQVAMSGKILDQLGPVQLAAAARLRSQIYTEEAVQAAAQGATAVAERHYRNAVGLLAATKPDTPAFVMANARLAGHLSANGQATEALSIFREIIRNPAIRQAASPALKEALRPYFRLLLASAGANAAAEIFFASQLVVTPGVAQTQAILARELSAGGTQATQLFRRSVNAGRVVEQLTAELSRLEPTGGPDAGEKLAAIRERLRLSKAEQVATLAALSGYSQFRAITIEPLDLDQLQAILRPGETYWKLSAVGQEVYAIVVRRDQAVAYLLPQSLGSLNDDLVKLRDSISIVEDGETAIYPFDVQLAHQLYKTLAGPASALIETASHLVFEADGEMSRLPVSVLATKASSQPEDPFDFTGVHWLGRNVAATTSVSARGFKDIRDAQPSRAIHEYIGFGENMPLGAAVAAGRPITRSGSQCSWPAAAWGKPISSTELKVAQSIIGDSDAKIYTRDQFTDTKIKQRGDLNQYRIVHFATHGLTDAPQRGCSAEPALLTSVGPDPESDGLLTFREIFDLQLDADLVILSACSTASAASKKATAAAGVRGSGEFPLDGLVRAFVGAGSRSVIATHWPVPDDFDATERLLGGIFRQQRGTSTADAIRLSQSALMNDKATSHPFYWAAFVVIGDGARTLLPRSE